MKTNHAPTSDAPNLKDIIIALNKGAIWHPDALRFLDEMQRIVQLQGIPNSGLVLIGEAGLGKSTLINSAVNRLAKASDPITGSDRRRPILKIKAQSDAKCSDLINALLQELKIPVNARSTLNDRSQLLKEALIKLEVQAIVVDEFKHFLRKRGSAQADNTVNYLKNLMDNGEHSIPVIITLVDDGEALLKSHTELYQRFASRIVRLRPFSIGSQSKIDVYQHFIDGLAQKLERQGVEASILYQEEIWKGLLTLSSGTPRLIVKFIEDLLMRKQDLRQPLTLPDFHNTYQSHHQSDEHRPTSPFRIERSKPRSGGAYVH